MDAAFTTKDDVKKSLPGYRARHGRFDIVTLPPAQYLIVDGQGDPNTSPEWTAAIEALYPLAYALKFASKTERQRDYVVPPLEALWWADDMQSFTAARDKSRWSWTALSLVPEWLTAGDVDAARTTVLAKGAPPPALGRVRLETLEEGLCVQTLHLGSFDDEGPVLAALHDEFIPQHGLRMTGRHHEVYFSDLRRVEPAKLRTLLRQPVERVEP
ncbi:GyrI-like domain-containing protein [Herbiconiux sp. 11R-BC]|uniref:GyrI-like domain-containing protein n=1 Tax=Herbiconiux sp. 11R-BC TaxID=3111637 RepID=UPI003C05C240